MMTEFTRKDLDEHAIKKAESSLKFWKETGAIFDGNGDWITLDEDDLKIIMLALNSMAEEISLD